MARFSFTGAEAPLLLNQRLLRRYGQNPSIQRRNAVVAANLPLVARIASTQARHTDLAFDDLFQLGCLGLIQAVQGFKAERSGALSTYAVPAIRGTMQHYLRDRHQALRSPHRLRSLQVRALRLQDQRRQSGLPALNDRALAAALGVRPERLQEARRLHQALRLRSLDERVPQEDGQPQALVDQLADPGPAAADPALLWLRSQLAVLAPADRRLLLGRYRDQRSWAELAEADGRSPVFLRRRLAQLLDALRQASRSAWASPIASSAASSV
ncbi:MAG: hypothetical protein RLZZ624_38 [Cyanobacteriota bacterium]